MAKTTFGIILGNRDFFPDHLISEARQHVQRLCSELEITPIMLEEHETKLGSVETYEHAKACA
ncbi:MAG: fucose isomerase, partial [Thermanaerothrix sp.]|nr:fucose isomerase [Thermanaerothrix sp.]